MPILKNCELHYAYLDPKRPSKKFNKTNPSWEVQIRTSDIEVKKSWEAEGVKAKLMVYKAGEDNEGEPILNAAGKKQWLAHLKKKSIKKDGTQSEPVEVVGANLKPVDPTSIGNGSIGNVRVFQYEYEKEGVEGKQLASVLMKIQLLKHIVYVPKKGGGDDDFDDEGETETIAPEMADSDTPPDDDIPF
jgi:hypothetical protein